MFLFRSVPILDNISICNNFYIIYKTWKMELLKCICIKWCTTLHIAYQLIYTNNSTRYSSQILFKLNTNFNTSVFCLFMITCSNEVMIVIFLRPEMKGESLTLNVAKFFFICHVLIIYYWVIYKIPSHYMTYETLYIHKSKKLHKNAWIRVWQDNKAVCTWP